ncbi:MAG: AbrB family transcriptional regulator [Sphingopyxis sp.]|uniref:AbrB family transcriptional regulator n=1 Tax=Sphingopyxis sp. TaxID=1908224 RepID=UPI003F72BCFC
MDDGTDEAAGKQYPRPPLTRWAALLALSIALTGLLELLAVPAAMLLGPMLAGIVLAMRGKTVTVPRPCFLASQAVIGCLIARYFEPGLLATLANDWPVFVGVTFAVFAASFVLGYLLMRSGAVPGTAAIWGSAPGGAAPMVILADAYGADARPVAVITYMRVLTVVVVASVLLVFVGDGHTAPDRSVALWQGFDLAALGVTLLVVLASVVAGLVLRIPAGPMISAIVIGTAWNWWSGAALATPAPLLAAAYAFIGWRIGLTFSRDVVASAARSLPWIILSSLVLVAMCAGLGGLLVWQLGIDPVTAYLATSPGGLDSIAIIAVSTHSDTPLVMSLQAMRFLVALSLGPRVAMFVSNKFSKINAMT